MTDEIKVHVVKVNNRPFWYMRYTDPETGRRVAKSSEETDRTKAIKAAGKWEDDLRAGRFQRVSNPTWAEFRSKFEDDVLAAKSQHTFNTATCVFNRVQSIAKPERLRQLDRRPHRLLCERATPRKEIRADDSLLPEESALGAALGSRKGDARQAAQGRFAGPR